MSEALRLDHQLCFALYAASRALVQAYAPLLEPLGLTYPQYLALLVLWEEDGASVKRLGERLHLDSGTLTPLLKRLEAQGLVTRERDAADARVVRVRLTGRGQQLRARAAGVPRAALQCTGLEVAELVRLRESLRGMSDTLRASGAEGGPAGPMRKGSE
jgi:DNA-binding MarR family transcriptional regulator